MFNLKSKLELKANLASTSSHAMSGRVTPRLQSVRPSFGGGDLLNQGASNAFPLFHCWNPCLTEQYNPTAILNFYRFLLKEKCHSCCAGIRAVFINNQYALNGFKFLDSKEEYDFCLSSKSGNTNAKGKNSRRKA